LQRGASFNTFDTFAVAKGFHVRAGWPIAARIRYHLVQPRPYQLGNDEALESGAWWFYAKLGFQPRDPATARLARDELSRAERNPRHRTRAARLRRLAERHLFFSEPAVPCRCFRWPRWGCAQGRAVGPRGFGPERAVDEVSTELLRHFALASLRGLAGPARGLASSGANSRPLDLGKWQDDERRALVDLIRAKGGRSDRD
jgi:hypothetical protein